MAYSTYEYQCGSCSYLNINDYCGSKDRCKCERRGGYHALSEGKCYAYDGPLPDGTRSDERDYRSLYYRWYIVTTIFNKLNLSDNFDCVYLLQSFRINFLENNLKYLKLLEKYDKVGVILSKCLSEDKDVHDICKKLLQLYLVHVFDYIKLEKYDDALRIYIRMLDLLCDIYEVRNVLNENSKQYAKIL